jgi:hypothetical protein
MNRSISKIRHIQESNLKVENRFLKENAPSTTQPQPATSVMVGLQPKMAGQNPTNQSVPVRDIKPKLFELFNQYKGQGGNLVKGQYTIAPNYFQMVLPDGNYVTFDFNQQ